MSEKLLVGEGVLEDDFCEGSIRMDPQRRGLAFTGDADHGDGVGFRGTFGVVDPGKNEISIYGGERYDVRSFDGLNLACFPSKPALAQQKLRQGRRKLSLEVRKERFLRRCIGGHDELPVLELSPT